MIGNKIADARKKASISQAQLAERLFISPQAVGKWERGESMPDITTFNRLAEILGVDLNYFSDNLQSSYSNKDSEESKPLTNLPTVKEKKKLSWDMSSGNWVDADFSRLKNLQEKFSSSNMQRCKFIESELSGLLLKNNNIDGCDFSSSDITKSHIRGSNLVNNKFMNCLLQEAEFSGSYIKGCDFTDANLTEAKFTSGSFVNNTIENAVWNRTSFNAMQIENIIFNGLIDDCYFDNCSFRKITFQNATLINTFFKGKKLKGIQFIDCQVDRLTYEFLKNGKADLNGITLLNP